MEEAVVVGLVAFFATAIFNGVPRIIADRTEPQQLHDASGRIYLPRGSALFFIALCLGFVAFGAFAVVADPTIAWAGLGLIFLFGYGVWNTALASRNEGSVVWDEQGIEGPGRIYPIPFRCNRRRVPWESILSYQDLAHGIVVLKCKDGKKLFWSNYFSGADFLKDLIGRNNPSVEFK